MRKFASVTVALVVAAGVMVAAPATAAAKVSNGVACTKLNATTTVSGSKYKCAKNPLTSSSKLTWLSIDCIIQANEFVKAKKDAAAIPAKVAEQIKVIDVGIVNETASKAAMQAKLDKANAGYAAAKAKFDAATSQAVKDTYKAIMDDWTRATTGYKNNLTQITNAIKRLENLKVTVSNQPVLLASDLADTKASAQLICTKGF